MPIWRGSIWDKNAPMKTDTLFYRLFQRQPGLVLELANIPIAAKGYQFRSEEIKQTAYRLDGILMPGTDDERPHIFVEVQFQQDPQFYARFFSEILLYLRQHPEIHAWHAVVIYPERATEAPISPAFRSLIQLSELNRVYLEDWRHRSASSTVTQLVRLIICTESEVMIYARRLLLGAAPASLSKTEWLDFIETIVVYKLPQLSREEIRDMLGLKDIELKQTRFYQDVFTEGRQEGRQEGEAALLLKLLTQRFGPVPDALQARIKAADAETLLTWAERILSASCLEEIFDDENDRGEARE